MAKNPDTPKKPGKTPKSKAPSRPATCSRSGRRWRNCSIPRSTAASAAWAPAPDCSRRRIIPGIAAPAAKPPRIARGPRRASTGDDVAKRDASSSPPPRAEGSGGGRNGTRGTPTPTLPAGEGRAAGATSGFDEAPQREFAPANYGTSATIPTLDPELAKQLGFTTEEEDAAAMARPPRNKMEALGVAATADALESADPRRPPRIQGRGRPGQNLDAASPAAPGEIRRRRAAS